MDTCTNDTTVHSHQYWSVIKVYKSILPIYFSLRILFFSGASLLVLSERHVISKVSFPARRTTDTATDSVQRSNVEDERLLLTKSLVAKLTGERLKKQ